MNPAAGMDKAADPARPLACLGREREDARAERGGGRLLLVILAIGLAARVVVLLAYLGTHGWQGETWEYEILANNLLDGRGFTIVHNDAVYRSYIVPVFPIICALLHVVGGPGLELYYVFHLSVAAGIIWLTYAVARYWYDPRTAGLAALLVALDPGLIIYHAYKVDVIALATFLFLLGIYVFARLGDSWNTWLAILVGVIAGVGVLTRPDLIAFFALPAVWVVVERRRFREVWRSAALILCMALVVTAPWLLRNYLLTGRVMLASIASESIWMGNNPNATGTPVTLEIQRQLGAAPAQFRDKVYAASEMEQEALFREEAWQYIAADPAGFLWRAVEKMYYFWWFTPTFSRLYYEWVPPMLVSAYKVGYGLLLGLAAYGLWESARGGASRPRRASLFLLTATMAIAMLHTLNYVEGRHRVMVMPMILILSAYGLAALARRGERTGR